MIANATRLCALLALLLPVAAGTQAQTLSGFDRDRGHLMLQQVRQEVQRYYFDAGYHGVDLDALEQTAAARIDQASSLPDMLASIAAFTLSLNDSHTFFVPPSQSVRVDYGWEMLIVGDSDALVSRVKPGSDAERQGVHPGDRVLALMGHPPTRGNIRQMYYLYYLLRPQRGLVVTLQSPSGEVRELTLAADVHPYYQIQDLSHGDVLSRLIRDAQREQQELAIRWIEFGKDAMLLVLPTFETDPNLLRDVLKHARGRQALIVDLRGNSGGALKSLQMLLGRLSPEDITVGTQRGRNGDEPLVAKGTGDDAFAGRLIVLVDSRSASASEVLARTVQLTGRGVVLGDRTAGEVMRSRYSALQQGSEMVMHYGVSVADADIVMPDGGRLEGTGVVPDSLILPTPSGLAAGEDPVLARALRLAGMTYTPLEAGEMLEKLKEK